MTAAVVTGALVVTGAVVVGGTVVGSSQLNNFLICLMSISLIPSL